MTPSNSIIRRIFRRVFLKKRKKTRGRRTRSIKRQSDRAIPSVTTSNNSTIDITNYYNISKAFNNNNSFNNNVINNVDDNNIDTNKLIPPPPIMSTSNRSSSGQRRDWRSGHKPIDDLIQEIRLEFPYPAHNLVWIPFDEFVNCKPIARGGYSAIYEAMWSKPGQTVALKCLDGSQDFSSDFLNEIKAHWCLYSQPQFLRCYGITQLQDGEFMMVMQYASFGDLRLHLQRNRISSWKDKIRILKQIARGLAEMHKRDLIHGDLHSGNVMNIDQSHFVIGDVGLCGPANRMTRKKGVYGVLPYVAPELLKGAEYSKKVDIYSFAVIMWEICSGIRPYAGTSHNLNMAKDICEGKRPPVPPGTPTFYSELMKSCWDANPNNRPDAPEVLKAVYHWLVNDSLDEYLRKGGSTILFNGSSSNLTHPEAVYYSRLLDFPELRKQVLSSRGPEYTSNLQNSSVEENNNNHLRPPLAREMTTQSSRGTLNSPQLKLRSSRETIESKISQSTYNSKQSRATYNNKPQDTSNSRPVPSKSSQRTSGKVPQKKYNSNSSKPSNYLRPSQNSSYSNSQTTLKSPQRSPMSPSQFYESARSVKSEDNVSVNSRALDNPLSVIIPDDDIATLTSFWSMDGPNLGTKDKVNTFAS